MTSAVLEAKTLYRFFHVGDDEVFALRGVDFVVTAGELVALVGPSGSGKSTLLNCLAGLDGPDGGTVHFLGRPFSRQPEVERAMARATSIGVMTQTGNLFSHLSVIANVRFRQQLAPRRNRRDAASVLRDVGLTHRLDALPETLSGGEAARAGYAVAAANDPVALLCDEPTGEVDSDTEAVIIALMQQLARRGIAVVVATHSTALAARADRIVHIRDGAIIQ
jgi:putative ABC transport system ATP-binding protein